MNNLNLTLKILNCNSIVIHMFCNQRIIYHSNVHFFATIYNQMICVCFSALECVSIFYLFISNIETYTQTLFFFFHISDDETNDVWNWPENSMCIGKLFFVFTWPIRFILWVTIPNCKKYKMLFFITFFMCILWIGFTSYFCAWQITVIGENNSKPNNNFRKKAMWKK